jgi:hypothetical protein
MTNGNNIMTRSVKIKTTVLYYFISLFSLSLIFKASPFYRFEVALVNSE